MGSSDSSSDQVAKSLSGDVRLLPYLPELLQDLWALGLGSEPMIRVLTRTGFDERTELRVLDLACGKGEALILLAKHFGWQGTGVDLMPAFINEARKRAEYHGVSHLVQFEIGDLAEVAVRGIPVDLILFGMDSGVFGGIEDSLRAIQRRLTSAGHIVFSTVWGKEGRPQVEGVPNEAMVREAVRVAGLRIVGEERIESDWVRVKNEQNTAHIRRRANELTLRNPEKKMWFSDYVKSQEEESQKLEEDLDCVVLLLQKETTGSKLG